MFKTGLSTVAAGCRRQIIKLYFVFMATGIAFAADQGGCYTFTCLKGRTVRARIIKYNSATGRLLLERNNQNRVWVDIDVFCKEDYDYIQKWCDSNKAMSEDALAISVERRKGRSRTFRRGTGKRQCEMPYHDCITIRKISDLLVKGLILDYRYFVAGTGRDKTVRQLAGTIVVGSVANQQTVAVETDAVVLVTQYESHEEVTVFGTHTRKVKVREDELLGIWIKVRGSGSNGVVVVRDICIPAGLPEKVRWEDAQGCCKKKVSMPNGKGGGVKGGG